MIFYTRIVLSLTLAWGTLTVAEDSNPMSEYQAFVGVTGSGWLHDSNGMAVIPGYYPLSGEDAEEVIHQAQQVGLVAGATALQCIADVLIEGEMGEVLQDIREVLDDELDGFATIERAA